MRAVLVAIVAWVGMLALGATQCFGAGGAGTPTKTIYLDEDTTIPVLGVVTTDSVAFWTTKLAAIESVGKRTVTLVIDSPGGYVDPGLKFAAMLEAYRNAGGKVRCLVTGMAMSMAYYLLAECDERWVMTRSQLLWHPIRVGVQGGITGESALALGQALLAFEQSMKEHLIRTMDVDPDWFDMHWRAETAHHGIDLAANAPKFVRVVGAVKGLPLKDLFWLPQAGGIFDGMAPTQSNGDRYWGANGAGN